MISSAPIIVMSFNRPEYLAQVLDTLVAQIGCGIEERAIYLFQDGRQNLFSKRNHGEAAPIEESVALFRRVVPKGTVMASPHNLGVALNFDRAELFAFQELGVEAAIFLEDDMVLSPHYVAALDTMLATYEYDSRVGYVAAYGDYQLPLEAQRADPAGLLTMHHNWAFALYRRQWQLMRPYVEQYLALVRDIDYRKRDNEAIWALYASWGFGRVSSSQDAAKTMAVILTQSIKIKCRACLGRYIGEHGLHMKPETFQKRGFANTQMFPDPLPAVPGVTDQVYKSILAELTRWAGKPQPAA